MWRFPKILHSVVPSTALQYHSVFQYCARYCNLRYLRYNEFLRTPKFQIWKSGNAKPTAGAMATKPDNASSLRFDPLQVEDFKRRKVAGDEYNSTSTYHIAQFWNRHVKLNDASYSTPTSHVILVRPKWALKRANFEYHGA